MARYYEAQAEVAARQREASVEADEDDEPPSFHYVVTDPTPTSTYRSSTHVPAIPLPALTEKEALARYHASQAPPEEAMPGGYMGTPDLSNPLRRTLSAGASSESGTTDEVTLQRDPSIALGKRRAETASPPPASVPYVSPSTRQATWDRRTNLYDIGPAGSPVERFGSPPPRPPKVPLR